MAPEFGATTAYFPVDEAGMDYLAMTGRSAEHIDFVRSYYKEADLWFDPQANPTFNQTLELDLATVFPSAAGPRDRKSTRLNSSHVAISYAVFCLKKKTYKETR